MPGCKGLSVENSVSMKVEIDSNSGFCGGVIRAIKIAEDYLGEHGGRMYSLGAVVHNEEELSRLEKEGLIPLDKGDLEQIDDAKGETLMVRAHGEPPEVYETAREKGFRIIDCTCPVVLKLQEDIREAYNSGRQIVIFGKVGHPEVLGLVGQVKGDAFVVEDMAQLQNFINLGLVDTDRDLAIFSQTTKSPVEYADLCGFLGRQMSGKGTLDVHDTICRQVEHRHNDLKGFAKSHDVIIFVSGRQSSNGKVLSDLCRNNNIRTYNVSSVEELQKKWFRSEDFVGVSGATSTPGWLLERVASAIENLQ